MGLIKKTFTKEDFLKKYKSAGNIFNEGIEYFKLFQQLLENEKLQEQMKFANDNLKVPPIKYFVLYEREYGDEKAKKLFSEVMDMKLKQSFGALFGYLYRFMYCTEDDLHQYKPIRSVFNDELTDIKAVSYFNFE